jgi:hypothetical protein
MRKNYIPWAILFFSFVFNACASRPAPPPPPESAGSNSVNFWDSTPSQSLVFIGGASLRSDREESVKLALQDIARKVSIFNAVEGEFLSYNKTGSSFFDYAADTQSSLSFDEDYLGFVENLEYDPGVDVIQIDNSIFVRARFRGPAAVQIPLRIPRPADGSSRPGWVDAPPAEISGYRVGIGYAGRRGVHRDTVNASFEAAIFAIIRGMSSQVSAGVVNYQGPGSLDYRSANDTTISARGKLTGFYVLDTWIDPSNMSVWTFAIARPEAPPTETAGLIEAPLEEINSEIEINSEEEINRER